VDEFRLVPAGHVLRGSGQQHQELTSALAQRKGRAATPGLFRAPPIRRIVAFRPAKCAPSLSFAVSCEGEFDEIGCRQDRDARHGSRAKGDDRFGYRGEFVDMLRAAEKSAGLKPLDPNKSGG
jgi:hypothetical protein